MLKDLIIKRINAEGAITFADFMEMALYYPELGYYTKKREPAAIPDYYTSCELHPVFGQAMANQISRTADFIKNRKFTVLEIGSGKGILAKDILKHLKMENEDLYSRLEFIVIERNERLLIDVGNEGCVISNELIDSFPVHRIRKEKGELKEIYVS